MLKCVVKIDDKEMFKEIAGKKAVVEVGWFPGQNYEAIEEGFYANVPKNKEMEIGYKFKGKETPAKPRRFSPSPEIPIAKVAIANEYGVPEHNVPPRPFMKRTYDGNARKWANMVRDELPQMKKMDLSIMAKRLATRIIRDTQTTINELMYPPNSPSTIRRKGFNNPLVDTGTMRDTMTWREVK